MKQVDRRAVLLAAVAATQAWFTRAEQPPTNPALILEESFKEAAEWCDEPVLVNMLTDPNSAYMEYAVGPRIPKSVALNGAYMMNLENALFPFDIDEIERRGMHGWFKDENSLHVWVPYTIVSAESAPDLRTLEVEWEETVGERPRKP